VDASDMCSGAGIQVNENSEPIGPRFQQTVDGVVTGYVDASSPGSLRCSGRKRRKTISYRHTLRRETPKRHAKGSQDRSFRPSRRRTNRRRRFCTCHLTKSIGGLPINPATKRLSGGVKGSGVRQPEDVAVRALRSAVTHGLASTSVMGQVDHVSNRVARGVSNLRAI